MRKSLETTAGSYTKELSEHMREINDAYADPSVSADAMRGKVLEVVSAARDTPARKSFVATLQRQKSKDAIVAYVYNATLRGCRMGADISDGFCYDRA